MRDIKHRINLAYFASVMASALSIYAIFSGHFATPAAAQNDMYLSRRIDQVEQRFYSLESRLNRLESAPSPSIVSQQMRNTSDVELQFLRTQIDGLRTRVGELECGLLRIDERTLSANARAAKKRNGEPCRFDPAKAVELSARP